MLLMYCMLKVCLVRYCFIVNVLRDYGIVCANIVTNVLMFVAHFEFWITVVLHYYFCMLLYVTGSRERGNFHFVLSDNPTFNILLQPPAFANLLLMPFFCGTVPSQTCVAWRGGNCCNSEMTGRAERMNESNQSINQSINHRIITVRTVVWYSK